MYDSGGWALYGFWKKNTVSAITVFVHIGDKIIIRISNRGIFKTHSHEV